MKRSVTSVIAWDEVTGAPGGQFRSVNPAQTTEVVAKETVGPLIGLMGYREPGEATRLANAPGYGLSSSIYTPDPAEAFRFRHGVSAGMVSINNSTSGVEAHLPFGGNAKSGNGSRQSGVWVLDQLTGWPASR